MYGKGKGNRPGIKEIIGFLPLHVAALFQEFSKQLVRKYDVGCKPPVFSETDGWVYSFGRYNVNLLNHIIITDNAFIVHNISVCDEKSLKEAIEKANFLYAEYKQRFEIIVAAKKEKQKQNNQRRIDREQKELEILSKSIDKMRFNKFKWSTKLSRKKLQKLYDNDVKGLCDDELIDDVGITLYARCAQGRDEQLLMESGRLKCHNCQTILRASRTLMQCQCGSQYFFRDYMRSFRKENMPSGAATSIFNAFIDNWEKAKGYAEKMRLIDGLVHEFHINLNSGVKGRFVGINLLDGTKKQIQEFILGLAYSDSAENFLIHLQKK